ncbi:polyketide synthase [Solwaraspora sp. WMMA2065]|nr:polyketide synthase [Solwaraspora sp. WMMA2065]WJK33676.1 polyketide synthase [Solwaraspora sp. WMMA2065]
MTPHNDPPAGPPAPIAVVGMSCRLPGADGIAEFWALLRRGGTAFSGVPEVRRRDWPPDALPPADVGTDPQGGFLSWVDQFDAAFFGMSPREAAALDPQHRLTLELAWEALEDSGQPRQRWAGRRAGVFVGAIADDYAALVHRAGPAAVDRHTFTGLQRGLIANRVSRLLGLTGPSLTVDAGQCSSLLAVHLACEQLWAGDVDLALAGGVHLNLAPDGWLAAARFGVLARSGASVPFDTAADGFRRGEGGGLVVLKPLRLAEADGDDIYCSCSAERPTTTATTRIRRYPPSPVRRRCCVGRTGGPGCRRPTCSTSSCTAPAPGGATGWRRPPSARWSAGAGSLTSPRGSAR